jgi:ABC-2 type transport system ATP-binding protein
MSSWGVTSSSSVVEPVRSSRDLTRAFDELIAVNAVLFDRAGALFCLVGSNGAGKTTLIRMLTTLLPPSSGTAQVAGFDVARASRAVRRRIGYVPQLVSADGGLTARENLLLAARLHGIPRRTHRERIDEALETMGLTGAADALVRGYSGGMIRRLEIAQAMLHRPAVLVLDEPTVGLDPTARHAVWDLLRDLRDRVHTTVLLSTHDMQEAELCSRVAVMHRGIVGAVPRSSSGHSSVPEPRSTTCLRTTREARSKPEGVTMRSHGPDVRRPDSAERPLLPLLAFAQQANAIAGVELRKLARDPTDVLTRSVQPLLWLLVFGQVFGHLHAVPTGDASYLEFLTPGVLAQSVLFSAIFYGIAIIWERDLGIVQMQLVSPAYRAALVLGKAAAAGVRGVVQAVIVYAIATRSESASPSRRLRCSRS